MLLVWTCCTLWQTNLNPSFVVCFRLEWCSSVRMLLLICQNSWVCGCVCLPQFFGSDACNGGFSGASSPPDLISSSPIWWAPCRGTKEAWGCLWFLFQRMGSFVWRGALSTQSMGASIGNGGLSQATMSHWHVARSNHEAQGEEMKKKKRVPSHLNLSSTELHPSSPLPQVQWMSCPQRGAHHQGNQSLSLAWRTPPFVLGEHWLFSAFFRLSQWSFWFLCGRGGAKMDGGGLSPRWRAHSAPGKGGWRAGGAEHLSVVTALRGACFFFFSKGPWCMR